MPLGGLKLSEIREAEAGTMEINGVATIFETEAVLLARLGSDSPPVTEEEAVRTMLLLVTGVVTMIVLVTTAPLARVPRDAVTVLFVIPINPLEVLAETMVMFVARKVVAITLRPVLGPEFVMSTV